jgi:beta-adrenergic-receptor kinase
MYPLKETVYESVNTETDKIEQKRRAKMKQTFYDDEKDSDLILQGILKKNTGTFGFSWQTRYAKLYPNRLELYYENKDKDPEVNTSFIYLDCIVVFFFIIFVFFSY